MRNQLLSNKSHFSQILQAAQSFLHSNSLCLLLLALSGCKTNPILSLSRMKTSISLCISDRALSLPNTFLPRSVVWYPILLSPVLKTKDHSMPFHLLSISYLQVPVSGRCLPTCCPGTPTCTSRALLSSLPLGTIPVSPGCSNEQFLHRDPVGTLLSLYSIFSSTNFLFLFSHLFFSHGVWISVVKEYSLFMVILLLGTQ